MWFGQQLEWLKDVSPLLLIFCICFLVTFLTEVTSNTATIESLLPILAGLAISTYRTNYGLPGGHGHEHEEGEEEEEEEGTPRLDLEQTRVDFETALADGEVLTAPNEDEIRKQLEEIRSRGIPSLAMFARRSSRA